MNNQIRGRNEQFRKNIRKKELEQYFRQKRQQLIQVEENPASLRLHEQIKEYIANQDIGSIYNLLFFSQPLKKLTSLSKQLCYQLFKFLMRHIEQMQCALLLKTLIDVQYRVIFLQKQCQEANIQYVDLICKIIDARVLQLSFNQDQSSKKQTMKSINAYLDCIRSLINKSQEKQGNYTFNYVFHPQFIQKLWPYFKYLYMNPFYLLILSFTEIDLCITSLSNNVQQILIMNTPAVSKLILQIDSKNKASALSSLMLANEIIRNLQFNKSFIIEILPSYLQMLTCAHSLQLNDKQLEGDYFYDMLSNVRLIFQQFSQELMPIHLGEIMSKCNLWTSLQLLVRIQGTNRVRRLGIKNILIHRVPLKDYINNTLISFLIEGTESSSIEVIVPCLEAIQLLMHDRSRLEEEVWIWFQEYEIDNILQNLEHSKNKQVAQMASYILDRIRQHEICQMSIEE